MTVRQCFGSCGWMPFDENQESGRRDRVRFGYLERQ